MSSAGGIELVFLPFALVFGATYLVGKGLVAGGKAIYKAHKEHEEKRLDEAKKEYEAVGGRLASIAMARHDEMAKVELKMSADFLEASEARDAKMRKAHEALVSADRSLLEYTKELPRYFEACRREVDETAEKEIEKFGAELEKACARIVRNVELEAEKAKSEARTALAQADAALTGQIAKSMMYAQSVRDEASTLLNVFKKTQPCDVFAPVELAMAEESLKKLDEYLKSGDVNAAVMMAADAEARLAILQVRVEQRQAEFGHQKAVLEDRAEKLKEMIEKTRNITEGSPEGVLDSFVKEDHDAVFWSEGKLSLLWDEAQALIKKVDEFSFADHGNPAVLTADLEKKVLELQQEHARVRSRLMGRAALMTLGKDVVRCMQAEGWDFVGSAYHKNASGKKDIRLPFDLIFRKGDDEWVITGYDEYDAESGLFKQGLSRQPHEAGIADEQKRRELDRKISDRMQALGHTSFVMTCTPGTEGKKEGSTSA